MKVGWIGLGGMGKPMVRNLLRGGNEVVVYNRTRDRAEEMRAEGARVADSPGEAAAAPVLVTMVADDAALEDIVFGSGKVLQEMKPGGTHVSMSTISVALSSRLAEEHRKAGQCYIAAPVFGRPEAAAAAKLFIVAAGPGDAVRSCQPLFEALGQRTYNLGGHAPAANVVKLSGNFLIASMVESLGEAFALVRKWGIDPGQFLEMLTTSLFAAPVYKAYGAFIAQDKYEPVGFRLPLGLKDVRLVLAAAESANVPMPLASLVRDRLITALALGMQEADWSSFARLAAQNAGLVTRP